MSVEPGHAVSGGAGGFHPLLGSIAVLPNLTSLGQQPAESLVTWTITLKLAQ